MILRTANHDLECLLNVLVEKGLYPADAPSIYVMHDPEQDQKILDDSRAFAYVMPEDQTIFLAAVFEVLPLRNRLGILLHELSHVINQTVESEDQEVDTDLWIIMNLPEAGYHYEEKVVYGYEIRPKRTARNLQTVSQRFADLVRSVT